MLIIGNGIVIGTGGTSGQVPIGPGWSSARAHTQTLNNFKEAVGAGGFTSTEVRTSRLEQQTSAVRKTGASKVDCAFTKNNHL